MGSQAKMSTRNINPRKVRAVELIDKLIHCLVTIADTDGSFLMTLPDGRIIDTKGWNDWEWTHGIGLYGLWRCHEINGHKRALGECLKWFQARFNVGTTKNVNTMAPLLTAAYLHERGHADYAVHLDSWAEWVMHEMPRTKSGGLQHITYLADNHQQLWDDTLMMAVLPLAKIGLLLNRPGYVEEAKRQFLLHVKFLQDIHTGLWFHAWTFEGCHHFSRARWGRGNCWVTMAIPDFLEMLQLSPTDGTQMFLKSVLKEQVDALVRLQDPETGLWHTILDDNSSYLEASATAGFAYGILKSLRLRLIPKEERYVTCAQKAIQAVIDNISEAGELGIVSFGTPVFETVEEYKRVPLTSMPYGQSLALLALTEHLRTFI